jgi:hypothetical protein
LDPRPLIDIEHARRTTHTFREVAAPAAVELYRYLVAGVRPPGRLGGHVFDRTKRPRNRSSTRSTYSSCRRM